MKFLRFPIYIPEWEGAEDPLKAKFPLQCITWKGRNRTNSMYANHPWLKEVAEQVLWINPADAEKRGN